MNSADRAPFRRVEETARLSRYGGDCYGYCMLAAGLIDLVDRDRAEAAMT